MKQSNLSQMFKALSSEQRIRILELLYRWDEGETCCEGVNKAFTRVSEELKISRSTISHHLKELENAGLISCVRNGQATVCKVNEDALHAIRNFCSCCCSTNNSAGSSEDA
ncbi:ArsR/SmtB family transcription factor [Spirochaeta dissipatitropha]